MTTIVKSVGCRGQITLGRQYAGKKVMIEQIETGVWMLKLAEFIPVSERWLQNSKVTADLEEAIAWAENNPPKESDINAFEL
ncbi:conserved hypothetical protein [Desulfamplus magnetovallimortis]|uniref:Uncharacterized protein n=1 Tax=Desulfamplus magnetovallimortis TaxID=1246637 RepID=A0A1W1H4L3_9BACT|nr:hypothetical protein [Desulfamplus magnetovallimortis]SLM27382.1 conserved hypothetical protein [Desulfamplus magnetovallimortis]